VAEVGLAVHPYGRMIQMTYLAAPAGLPDAVRRPIVAMYREAILSPEYQAKAEEDCYIADGLAGDELNAVLNETMQSFRAAQARVQG
jgi:tripartite-type tricarboxylate transporter receptor subunit TctC